MPYFITDKAEGCSGWATIKDDGEVIGCHQTKADAIAQMVAVSIAEDMEPGGERALPDNYRPALALDVPDGRACGNCFFYNDDNVQGDKAWCEKWDEYVSGAYYCNAWQPDIDDDDDDDNDIDDVRAIVETRATPPNYMQEAAARGLELRREGFAGDGVTDATVREAREMADGNISDDKIIRAFAWSRRHAVDLRAPKNNDPNHPDWPGAGAVAHYLWGINPLNPQPAIRFLERESNRLQGRTTMSDLEIRTIDTEPLELRAAATGDGMTFTGYAAKYDSPSLPLPFVERIAPGAFTRSLKSRNDIKMFVNHSDLHVLASTRAKTLRLEDRPDGLFVEADLPDVTYANDLRVLIERGDVSTMSFGFSTVRDSWSDNGAERILNEVRLHEVSVVTSTAAYPATTASVRNLRLIARRTATDFDALTDAIAALELGELSDDQASLLRTVVDSAAGKLEEVPAEANVPMGILINKLDLIAKQLNI
jgi:HK97 family phage prohead protease